MNIQKHQIITIRTLISKHGLDKDEVVFGATGGRSSSTKELTYQEAVKLIKFLKTQEINESDRANMMRRKIISACHEMHLTSSPGRIDMDKVNALVVKHGYLKPQALNDYTLEQLPTLVTQVQRIRDSYLLKLSKGYVKG